MARERKKIVVEDEPDTMDLSEFVPDMEPPAKSHTAEEIKAISEKSGFPSREPTQAKPRKSRRKKSPYTAQLGARVRPDTKDRFQDMAVSLNITDAEALDEALTFWLEQKGAA